MGKTSTRGGSMKTTFNQNNFSKVAFCSQNRKATTSKVRHENTKKVPTVRVHKRICDKVTNAIIAIIAVCIAVYIGYQYKLSDFRLLHAPQRKCNSNLKVLVIAPENDKTITHIFQNLGYEIVHDINDNWDVLWSTTADPFNLHLRHMTTLKPHQIVNHFPPDLLHYMSYVNGSSQENDEILKKHNVKFILRSFKLPEMEKELMYYEKESQKIFIIRDCLVNGMKVINANYKINYNASLVLQELPDNPLYINEYILELAVYALVSSVNPLRIYRYNDDVDIKLFKPTKSRHFCFNPQMPPNEFNKNTINSYLNRNGYNATSMYENIDNAIASFLMMNEQYFVGSRKNAEELKHFIQLMRFNFIMDEKLNVYVREVETLLDPNGIQNYGKIVYGALNLIGGSSYYEYHCRISTSCELLSLPKDIVSPQKTCIDNSCNESSACSSSKCELCCECLNLVPNTLIHLHRSYREQIQCGHMYKRIFPVHSNFYDGNIANQLSSVNRLSLKWFKAKCETDSAWC